jgi:hypothetical protein
LLVIAGTHWCLGRLHAWRRRLLVAKLVRSYSCADERLLEAPVEMAGRLAPGRQSYRVDARAGVRYQVAMFGGLAGRHA